MQIYSILKQAVNFQPNLKSQYALNRGKGLKRAVQNTFYSLLHTQVRTYSIFKVTHSE